MIEIMLLGLKYASVNLNSLMIKPTPLVGDVIIHVNSV